MGLKNYQKKAIQDGRRKGLLPPTFDILTSDNNEKILIVLKAITGSGKTVIASEYIEQVLTADKEDRGNNPICIIWLSKGNGMLHMQSSEKIKSYIKSAAIHVNGIENSSDFTANRFYDNDVYVINWEKLYTDNNLVIETENPNIPAALKNTPSDMKFILIVDEFHAGYEQDTYNRMVELFQPTIILGMSATPTKDQLAKADEKVIIHVKDIQNEAMVKMGIKFNAQTDLPSIDKYETQEEYFLKLALARRDLIEQPYKDEGIDIIPLLLIQFDDEGKGKDVNTSIISIISVLDAIYDNNKNDDYAIWMDVKKNSPIKRSSDNIIKNLDVNKVKVLLFKQAIATGWDCPRAQVILRYRKINDGNGTFDLQTLGRIFRMPEPNRGMYYNNPSLNYGYVYSIDNTYKLEQGFSESLNDTNDGESFENTVDYIKNKKYSKAVNEFEALTAGENNTIVTNQVSDDDLCDEVDRIVPKIAWLRKISNNNNDGLAFKESSAEIADEMTMKEGEEFIVQRTSKIREREVKRLFNTSIPSSYSTTVRDQIETDIKKELKNGYTPDQRNIVTLENEDGIGELMKALDEFRKKHEHRYKGDNIDFLFPEYISIIEAQAKKSSKSLYGISSDRYSNPEKIFINKLEANPNVLFWYKNSDSGRNAFCVAYDVNMQQEPTYPDFIVAFNDGTYGIYEIKDEADTKKEIPLKKDAIEKRIRELNKKHKGKFHGTLLKVNIKNKVVIDMDSFPEFT